MVRICVRMCPVTYGKATDKEEHVGYSKDFFSSRMPSLNGKKWQSLVKILMNKFDHNLATLTFRHTLIYTLKKIS